MGQKFSTFDQGVVTPVSNVPVT